MSEDRPALPKNLFWMAVTLLLTTVAQAEIVSSETFCHDLATVAPGGVSRASGTAPGTASCFAIDVPAAGLVTLEASVPGFSPAVPRLLAVDRACRPIRLQTAALVLEEGASQLTLWAPAGARRFCVRAQDPRLGLESFRVLTRFVELDLGGGELSASGIDPARSGTAKNDTGNGEDPRELEIDPEGVAIIGPVAAKNDTGNGEDPRELEIDPEGIVDPPVLALARIALCHHRSGEDRNRADDHGDAFVCATEIAAPGSLAGELRNRWGDDADTFRLTVKTPRTWELRTVGTTDTFGSLYDHRGDRLATDDDGGESSNFRLIKTLLPGSYYLRVEGTAGSRGEGPYRLLVTEVGGTR